MRSSPPASLPLSLEDAFVPSLPYSQVATADSDSPLRVRLFLILVCESLSAARTSAVFPYWPFTPPGRKAHESLLCTGLETGTAVFFLFDAFSPPCPHCLKGLQASRVRDCWTPLFFPSACTSREVPNRRPSLFSSSVVSILTFDEPFLFSLKTLFPRQYSNRVPSWPHHLWTPSPDYSSDLPRASAPFLPSRPRGALSSSARGDLSNQARREHSRIAPSPPRFPSLFYFDRYLPFKAILLFACILFFVTRLRVTICHSRTLCAVFANRNDRGWLFSSRPPPSLSSTRQESQGGVAPP